MFLLFLYFYFSYSIWWKYNPEEYPKLEEESIKKPIFAVCTLPTCPHCKGLPTLLRQFSDKLGDKSKIVFTALSCVDNALCNKIGVRSVPTFVLIRGNDTRYWTRTHERNMKGWSSFLAEQTKLSVYEVTDESQRIQMIRKTYDGGTTFHLQLPEKNTTLLKKYKEAASFYGLRGCTFAYTMIPETEQDKKIIITAFHSPKCSFSQEIHKRDEIMDFVEKHKFSSFHHFDSGEINDLIDEKKSFLLTMTDDPLPHEQRDALELISQNHCNDIITGWGDRNNDQLILDFVNKEAQSNPFYFVVNPQKKCLLISDESLSYVENDHLINRSLIGDHCQRIPQIQTNRLKSISKRTVILSILVVCILCICYFLFVIFSDNNSDKIE